jgi:hypothetical protein
VRCYQNIKQCVVSGWVFVALDVELAARKFEHYSELWYNMQV